MTIGFTIVITFSDDALTARANLPSDLEDMMSHFRDKPRVLNKRYADKGGMRQPGTKYGATWGWFDDRDGLS